VGDFTNTHECGYTGATTLEKGILQPGPLKEGGGYPFDQFTLFTATNRVYRGQP